VGGGGFPNEESGENGRRNLLGLLRPEAAVGGARGDRSMGEVGGEAEQYDQLRSYTRGLSRELSVSNARLFKFKKKKTQKFLKTDHPPGNGHAASTAKQTGKKDAKKGQAVGPFVITLTPSTTKTGKNLERKKQTKKTILPPLKH